jgi:2-methylcitrate dehydratase PrpD
MSADAQLAAVLDWVWATPPPAEVEKKTRLLLLDTLGCVLASSRKPKLQKLAAHLANVDPGQVKLPGYEQKLSASSAAFLFATSACWDEACEGLARAHGRPGVPVIAVAFQPERKIEDVLNPILCGYEAGGRLGEAIRMAPGMHVDATWPGMGAAVAAVRLGGGSATQALDAVRTVACQMPHSRYLPVKAGAEIRNTYLAHSAQLGLLAANAALGGLTSPEGALDELKPKPIGDPGEWRMLEGYLKPYAAVRHTHYGARAAQELRPQVKDRLDQIQSIELSVYGEALTYCGNRAPVTAIQAQFSLSYAVAAALVLGDLGPDAYVIVGRDSAIARLEQLVDIAVDPQRVGRGATLTIDIGTQRMSETIDGVIGDPGRPMSRDDVIAKFRRYAEPTLGARHVTALTAFVLHADLAEPARTCFTVTG